MKQLIITAIFTLFAVTSQCAQKIAIGASGSDEVVVIDKSSGAIEARYPIGKGGECNSVYVDSRGNIIYSYKQGARMVSAQGKVVWDYKVAAPAELQSVAPTTKGYVLAICSEPARIVEVNKKGKVLSETTFSLDTKSIHGQFRQITVMPNGTYLIPVMSRGEVINIDRQGRHTGEAIEVKGNLFSVSIAPNGNYIVSAGDAHCAVEINPKTAETVRYIADIDGITLAFVAQTVPRKDGSMLIANWLGHFKGDKNIPHIIEIDNNGKVVWSYQNSEHQKGASAIYEFNK